MTTSFDEEAAIRSLLAPLARVAPATRRHRARRPMLIALAAVVALLAVGGIAAAEGLGPFAGIGAVDHPPTLSDALDPAMKRTVGQINGRGSFGPTGGLIAHSARLVTQLDSGRRIYVIATTTNKLCVLIEMNPGNGGGSAMGCGDPLSQAQPTTEEQIRVNQKTPPLAFGVARDEVTSVSFRAEGQGKTVPVIDNVWAYEGSSNIMGSLTLHFRDGTETTISH
jgi:hypothetical protein